MSLIELKDTPVTTAADWLCFLFGKVEAGWVILFSVDRETGFNSMRTALACG